VTGANLCDAISGTTSTFYVYDPQGSVAERLDANEDVVSSDLYDAYGNKLAGNPNNDPYGYDGQWGYYTDSETGLALCTYRYYDPSNGRWLTRDPIALGPSASRRWIISKELAYALVPSCASMTRSAGSSRTTS